MRGVGQPTLESRQAFLAAVASTVVDEIVGSRRLVPPALSELCDLIAIMVLDRFEGDEHAETAALSAVSGIFFLRAVGPMLAAPSAHSLLPSVPPRAASRGLVLVSKVVIAVANGAPLGQKEPFMAPLNSVVEAKLPALDGFLRSLTSIDTRKKGRPRGKSTGNDSWSRYVSTSAPGAGRRSIAVRDGAGSAAGQPLQHAALRDVRRDRGLPTISARCTYDGGRFFE